MNAQLYNEPLVPGVDPMPTDVATQLQPAPCLWHRSGPNRWSWTSMVAAYLLMPV